MCLKKSLLCVSGIYFTSIWIINQFLLITRVLSPPFSHHSSHSSSQDQRLTASSERLKSDRANNNSISSKSEYTESIFHLFHLTMEINQIIYHSINKKTHKCAEIECERVQFSLSSLSQVTRFKIPVVTGVFLAHRLQLRSSLHWWDDDAMKKRRKILKNCTTHADFCLLVALL